MRAQNFRATVFPTPWGELDYTGSRACLVGPSPPLVRSLAHRSAPLQCHTELQSPLADAVGAAMMQARVMAMDAAAASVTVPVIRP